MRTPLTNPFSPGSDAVPEVWAGRSAELSDWRDVLRPRRLAGLYERGRTILGEPGLGKSALVRRIAQEAAAQGDWVTPQLRIPSGADPLKLVAAAVLELAGQAGLPASRENTIRHLLERVESVAISGMSLAVREAAGPEPFTALRELLIAIGEAAVHDDRLVLLHVDEVQNITDHQALSQLLIALGDALAHTVLITAPGDVLVPRHLPLGIYLTGLSDFEDVAGSRKGATFARRFKTTVLGAIDDADLTAALRPFVTHGWHVPDDAGATHPISMDPDSADTIVDLSRGEPFLFQLAGEAAWNSGSRDRIAVDDVHRGWHQVKREASAHVERILSRLPDRERDFIEAMAALPPEQRTLTAIARSAGFSRPSDAGTTTNRLDTVRGIIDRGKPYTFRHRAIEAYLSSSWPDYP